MKSLIHSITCLLGLAAISAAPLHAQGAPTKNIVDTAVAAGSFKTLTAALAAAGLVDTLKGEGPFTVFAPTDEAFAKLPEGAIEYLLERKSKSLLTEILTNHVVAGEVPLSKALDLGEATTLLGSLVKISSNGGSVKIGDATLVTSDIKTTNGVIHVIDAVLVPAMPDPAAIVKNYQLMDFINLARERGGEFAKKGEHEVRSAIYEVVYQTLLVTEGVCEESRNELTRSLAKARSQDSTLKKSSVLSNGLPMPMTRLQRKFLPRRY